MWILGYASISNNLGRSAGNLIEGLENAREWRDASSCKEDRALHTRPTEDQNAGAEKALKS